MDKDDDLNDFVVSKEESNKAKRKLFPLRNQEPKSKKAKSDSKSELKDFDLTKGPQFKIPKYLPTGEFRLHSKWTSSSLYSALARKKIEVLAEKNQNFVGDFQLPGGTVGLIISEKEYTGDGKNFYKKRVIKFYKAFKGHPSVILCLYDSQNNSQTNFIDLQEFCVLEFGFSLIPIKNLDQVPQVVEQLILTEPNRKKINPFKFGRNRCTFLDQSVIKALQKLQGIRKKRAKRVLQVFPNLKSVVTAPETELAKVIGKSAARGVWHFFHRKTRK